MESLRNIMIFPRLRMQADESLQTPIQFFLLLFVPLQPEHDFFLLTVPIIVVEHNSLQKFACGNHPVILDIQGDLLFLNAYHIQG